jgi:hypothetical protein
MVLTSCMRGRAGEWSFALDLLLRSPLRPFCSGALVL